MLKEYMWLTIGKMKDYCDCQPLYSINISWQTENRKQ